MSEHVSKFAHQQLLRDHELLTAERDILAARVAEMKEQLREASGWLSAYAFADRLAIERRQATEGQ